MSEWNDCPICGIPLHYSNETKKLFCVMENDYEEPHYIVRFAYQSLIIQYDLVRREKYLFFRGPQAATEIYKFNSGKQLTLNKVYNLLTFTDEWADKMLLLK